GLPAPPLLMHRMEPVMSTTRIPLLVLGLSLAVGVAAAAPKDAGRNWPGWRGPNSDGSSAETGLPVKFSPTAGVRWSVDMPGPSAATPVVWGDSVFLTAAKLDTEELLAICVDRKTGKTRWSHSVGSGYRPAGK